jgi:serine protease inhibitor
MKFSVKFAAHVTALVLIVQFAEAQQPAPDYGSIVNANTRFALKIVRGRASGLKQNEVVSPIALSAGFALLRNGANSQCAAEIGGAFEFGQLPNDDSNREYGALMGELLSREPERPLQRSTGNLNQKSPAQTRATRQAVSSEPKPPNGLYLANSFWNLRTNFSDAFRSVNADFYHAKVAHLSRAEDAVAAINAWANAKSYGRITRVVDSAGSDAFLFASLLYFRAHWRTPFLASSTHESDFTLLSGAKKTEQMMKEFGHFSYQQTAEFEAIVLPYNDGRDLYVFLPAESSSLQQFEASLTDENWNKWRKAMSYREGTVEMPKFAVGAEVDVQKLLTDIGTDCAFAGFAAFSKAFPLEGGKLTHAEQLLSFSADELGSEAVVYTGVGGVPGGVAGGAMGLYQAPPPFHMVVNRPFFATIVDERTRTMVLVSSIVEP